MLIVFRKIYEILKNFLSTKQWLGLFIYYIIVFIEKSRDTFFEKKWKSL